MPIVRSVPSITADETRKAWRDAIVAARRSAGRTQADVAAAANVDQKTVSRIENGGPCSLDAFGKVADALGVSLLDGSPQ